MKIGYIIPINMGFAKFNGIKVQAETWANMLKEKGHIVDLINPWEYQDLQLYDVVHVFSSFTGLLSTIKYVYNKNHNIILSPIIDSNKNMMLYKVASHISFPKLRLESCYSELRKCVPYVKRWLTRSKFESTYIETCFGVPADKVAIVPLSYRTTPIDFYPEKEKYCLHVSYLTDGRKNVERLVDAAIKYNFKLVLAGGISSDSAFSKLKSKIDAHDNVSYLGRVTDEELVNLYKRAKVFALPSLYEGVGMVAVEAASFGCDIVVTNIGGPKEYYADMSYHVNPYDIDSIGKAVVTALSESKYQPNLQQYVVSNYNLPHCVDLLIDSYK